MNLAPPGEHPTQYRRATLETLHLTKGKIMPNTVENLAGQRLLDVLIKAGLIAVLAIYCYGVFLPFLNLMLWSLILILSAAHLWLRSKVGSDGRAATLLVLIAIALMIVPVYFLGTSLAESAAQAVEVVRSDEYHIPPPPESVAGWPLIGARPTPPGWRPLPISPLIQVGT